MAKQSKKVKNYESGGRVRGPGTATSDSILARVSNGEYVLLKETVDMVGLGSLETLREAGLQARQASHGLPPPPRYAGGGLVGGLAGLTPPLQSALPPPSNHGLPYPPAPQSALPLPGYADGGMVGGYYVASPEERTRLNSQFSKDVSAGLNSADSALKSATGGASRPTSTAYGVGALTPPPPKPQIAPSSPGVPATPGNEWGALNDKWGIERPTGLPPPPNSWKLLS